jgi:glutathione S-transferase
MKLFYSPGACSLASDIVLHEAKLDASFIKVDLKSKKTEHGEDYAAINPKGYVPAVMLDDGDLLTENVAILLYLASMKPGLLPQEGMAKWHAIETLAFVSTELHKAFKPFFDPSAPAALKQTAKETLAQRFGLFAKQLGDREFIVGDAFTVVDAYAFVMLRWGEKYEVAIPPKLTEYAARLKKRASVRAALTNEGLA